MEKISQLLDFDREHIWHPYAPLPGKNNSLPVIGTEGVEIILADGRRLIDGMASWWSVIHGYNHPVLNKALIEQTEKFAHVMFGGLTHEPAITLVKKLIDITPQPLDKVFLTDSGSIAVEVALKMAIQYQAGIGKPEKQKFLTVKNGYHGDTFGAMSVCDPVNGMHSLFSKVLPQQYFAPAPHQGEHPENEDDIEQFAELLEQNQDSIAAVILEPIVQNAGGMRIYRASYLKAIETLCKQHNVLLILDEIATGFGRTGTLFAAEQAGVIPDILCVGKTLTAGYMTLGATLTTQKIADGISASESGALMHGPTYMGNPLACAVANASIDLLLSQPWKNTIANIEKQLTQELEPCRNLANVKDVRIKGGIGIVELHQPIVDNDIQNQFVDAGIWIRPFSNLVYVMPPYIITSEQLNHITQAIYSVLVRDC